MTDPKTASAANTPSERVRVAHGNVVNVRPIHSRGVTRIEIELPIESHIEATSLLYGKDVLIMGVKLGAGAAYGITDGTLPGAGTDSTAGGSSEGRATQSTPSAPGPSRGGLHKHEDTLDIVRWLGVRCASADFQDWLQVRNEAAAVEQVRLTCGVQSRADIPKSPAARRAFIEKIYRPFIASVGKLNGLSMTAEETVAAVSGLGS